MLLYSTYWSWPVTKTVWGAHIPRQRFPTIVSCLVQFMVFLIIQYMLIYGYGWLQKCLISFKLEPYNNFIWDMINNNVTSRSFLELDLNELAGGWRLSLKFIAISAFPVSSWKRSISLKLSANFHCRGIRAVKNDAGSEIVAETFNYDSRPKTGCFSRPRLIFTRFMCAPIKWPLTLYEIMFIAIREIVMKIMNIQARSKKLDQFPDRYQWYLILIRASRFRRYKIANIHISYVIIRGNGIIYGRIKL